MKFFKKGILQMIRLKLNLLNAFYEDFIPYQNNIFHTIFYYHFNNFNLYKFYQFIFYAKNMIN